MLDKSKTARFRLMMSVHDALEAWQAGEITSKRAMALTDATSVLELYAFASTCGVVIRRELTTAEAAAAEAATHAINARTIVPEEKAETMSSADAAGAALASARIEGQSVPPV
jgi:hypothetical protein